MGISDFLFGKKGGFEQASTMTGGQTDLLSQLMSGLSGGQTGGGALGGGMDFLQNLLSGDTSKFEQPLMRQFQEQTIPQLAEKFAGFGGMSSGSFNQALGQAGAGLSENLGALRGQLGMQGLGQLQGLMGQGLGAKSFENVYRPSTTGFVGGMAPGLGAALGMGMTGGFGGGGMGSILSSLMNLIKGGGGQVGVGDYGAYPMQGNYNMYSGKTGLY